MPGLGPTRRLRTRSAGLLVALPLGGPVACGPADAPRLDGDACDTVDATLNLDDLDTEVFAWGGTTLRDRVGAVLGAFARPEAFGDPPTTLLLGYGEAVAITIRQEDRDDGRCVATGQLSPLTGELTVNGQDWFETARITLVLGEDPTHTLTGLALDPSALVPEPTDDDLAAAPDRALQLRLEPTRGGLSGDVRWLGSRPVDPEDTDPPPGPLTEAVLDLDLLRPGDVPEAGWSVDTGGD